MTGANCMKGRELTQALATLKERVEELRERMDKADAREDKQQDWNHSIDLRVSKVEWTAAKYAAMGAAIATAVMTAVIQLGIYFVTH